MRSRCLIDEEGGCGWKTERDDETLLWQEKWGPELITCVSVTLFEKCIRDGHG